MRFPLTELDGQLTASRDKELLSSRELLYEHRTCVCLSSTEVAAQALSSSFPNKDIQLPWRHFHLTRRALHSSSWPETQNNP